MNKILLCGLLLCLLGAAGKGYGQEVDIYVSKEGSDTSGNGSESKPFASIQKAIDSSKDGETVLVLPGTYKENINYNGKNITVASKYLTTEDKSYIESTIIDGDEKGSVVTFENGEGLFTKLEGFTIQNGTGGGPVGDDGGGVLCYGNSNPNLNNLIIINNSAQRGGGVCCLDSEPTIQNVLISSNVATLRGGGVYSSYKNPKLLNVLICRNTGDGLYGRYNNQPSLKNVTIVNNNGNGIYCENNSKPTLTNSIIWSNSLSEVGIGIGSVNATYSLIEGGWEGEGNISYDPLFIDVDNDDYSLKLDSPSIDSGNPDLDGDGITWEADPDDQDPDGSRLDIGAIPYFQDGPLIFSKQPESLIVQKGGQAFFDYSAEGGWFRTYQWERNGVPIPDATQPSLTIENATSKDSGLYRVTITNKHGSVTSDEAVLKVVTPGSPQTFADGKEVIGSVVKGDKAEITLSTSFEGGGIFYTLDGSEPSFETSLYDEPFSVSKTTGIRAVAYKKDFSDLAEADPVFINIVPNYSLNVSVEGQGTVVKDPADGPYMQDSVVKLKAVPAEGWRFSGWSGALKSSFEEGSVVVSSDKSITAKFELIPTHKLIVKTSAGGVVKGINNKRLTLIKGGSYSFNFDINKAGANTDQPMPSALQVYLYEDVHLIPNNGFVNVEMYVENETLPLHRLNLPLEGPFFGLDFAENHWPKGRGKITITNLGSQSDDLRHTIQIGSIYITLERRRIILNKFDQYFNRGTAVNLGAENSSGSSFIGWLGDASGASPNLTLTMDRDKTVEAVFGTDLKTTATGKGKLILDPPNGPYPYGSKVNITPVPDAGYYLGVWGADAAGMPKGPIEYEITKANPEITALFVPLKENRFTVTTLASSGGSVVSNPNSNAYVNAQQVTLTATPEPGYSFVGWTGDIESTANPLITLADANKTVTAEFRRNIIAPVTLTINAENGSVTRTPADELYEKGTSVELLAQAYPGYTFTGWAGALGGTASRVTLFLDGDKVVTANFKASYQLATETRGPGSVLTTPSSTKFIDGDEVILTASPGEGYGFVGWTGDLESTDQQTTLTMDSNKKVIAHFAQLGTLTTWTRGQGTIARSPDKESYFPGASVTLTAKPGDGFQFVNWSGQASGTKNPTTVTMDRAMSVAANFKDIKAPTVSITSPSSQETGDETFTLSGAVTDNGKIKTLVWLWKGNEMGELELVDGKFSLKDQKLVGGANEITVVATDRSSNEGKAAATPVWTPNRSIRIATATEQQEGNRIEVPIEINSKGDVGGMGFVLNYNHSYLMDPVLTWSSAAGGSINLVNEDVAGELRGTFSLGGTSLPAGEQLIGTVSFRARSVPETLETALGLQDLAISDSTGNKLTSGTDVVSGQARVLVRGITGDNNANNRLDVGDATRIQRLLVGMDRARAWDVTGNDLNGSGDLDPGDVVKVLRTVVGIDPQPNRNREIAKMGGDDDEVETVLLFLKEKTANTVTVQVQLKDMQSTIAGANFQLEYSTELLRLKDRSSHSAGGMVAKNAAAIWNVSPAQTDYSKQDGTLAMAVSSPEPWTVKDGVLAELSFEVQDGADLNKAVLSLSEVEVSPDGFDNRMLDGLEFNVGSGATTEPEPSIIQIVAMTRAPFAFSFGAKEGRVYDVQSSQDLRSWGTLKSYNGTGTLIRFEDERDQVFPQIYYRVRSGTRLNP